MSDKIKSCPFCGCVELNVNRTNKDACWIECAAYKCHAQSASHPAREGAIRIWNRRSRVTTTDTVIVEDGDREYEATERRARAAQ